MVDDWFSDLRDQQEIQAKRLRGRLPIYRQKTITDPGEHIADLAANQQPYANVQDDES